MSRIEAELDVVKYTDKVDKNLMQSTRDFILDQKLKQ